MSSQTFKIKDEIKFLRVILDENKIFKQHIKELCRKLFLIGECKLVSGGGAGKKLV